MLPSPARPGSAPGAFRHLPALLLLPLIPKLPFCLGKCPLCRALTPAWRRVQFPVPHRGHGWLPRGNPGIPSQLWWEQHRFQQDRGDILVNKRNIGCGKGGTRINETIFAEGKAWNVPRAVRDPGKIRTQPGVNWCSLELLNPRKSLLGGEL